MLHVRLGSDREDYGVKCFDSDVSRSDKQPPRCVQGPRPPSSCRFRPTPRTCTVFTGTYSPVLGLVSPGAGPVELERGGTLVLVLLLGVFSMLVSVQWVLRPSSGQRAAELSSIKQKNEGGKRVAVSAGQATKALIHFCQTRRPHHGDILTLKQSREKIRDTISASQVMEAVRGEDESSPRGAKTPEIKVLTC